MSRDDRTVGTEPDLESRLRAALAARADAVDDAARGPVRALPAPGGGTAPRGRRWRPLAAAAAVLVLVGGTGVGALAWRDRNQGSPAVIGPSATAHAEAFPADDPLREDPYLEGGLDTGSTDAAGHLTKAGESWCPTTAPTYSTPRTESVVAVYVCRLERFERVAGDGTWIAEAARVTSDFDPVLQRSRDALQVIRKRDPQQPLACMGYLTPQFWLHLRDGRIIRWSPRVTDPCGQPSDEDRRTWDAVTATPVVTVRGPHAGAAVGSTPEDRAMALEKTTGCSGMWKDMIRETGSTGMVTEPGALPSLVGEERHVCLYRVRDGAEGAGLLVGGQTWDAERSAPLVDALRGASAGDGCRAAGHRIFAVVLPGTADGELTIALDGCGLLLGSRWWTVPPSVRELLLAVPHED